MLISAIEHMYLPEIVRLWFSVRHCLLEKQNKVLAMIIGQRQCYHNRRQEDLYDAICGYRVDVLFFLD